MNGVVDLNYKPIELVSTENMDEQSWLKWRRKGIGGSDVAAILGVSPFMTARDLYYDKIGESKMISIEDDNWIAKKVGHLLEDLVAEIFSKKTGYPVFKREVMFQHPYFPYMIADIDYFTKLPSGEIAILECKTSNLNCLNKWSNNTVPLNYELQCRHYMAVTNINKVFIACLLSNNEQGYLYRTLERDLDYEKDLIEQEAYFWNEFVIPKIKPPYSENGDLVLKSIKSHFGEGDADVPMVHINPIYGSNIETYLALNEEKTVLSKKIRELEDKIKRTYAPIVDELGNACTGKCGFNGKNYLLNYNSSFRTSINKKNLERLEKEEPDIYSDYATTTENRRFSIKEIS